MSPETPNDEKIIIPPDIPGFFNLVKERFKGEESFLNIEDAAQNLVKKEGMEHFAEEIPTIRERLKEFFGSDEWKKIRTEEGKRWLEGDRAIKGATGG